MKSMCLGLILITLHQVVAVELVDQLKEPRLDSNECVFPNEHIHEQVYIGWPLSIPCWPFKTWNKVENAYYEDNDLNDTFYCSIYTVDNNRVFYKTAGVNEADGLSYNIEHFNETSSTQFRIKSGLMINRSACFEAIVRLNATILPEMSCNDSLSNSTLTPKMTRQNNALGFVCEPSYTNKNKLHGDFPHEIRWYRNCEETEHTSKEESDGGAIHRNCLPRLPSRGKCCKGLFQGHNGMVKLHISMFGFEHLAIYSCAIVHNGQKQYLNHFKTCIFDKFSGKEIPIVCSKKRYGAKTGDTLTIECQWNGATGILEKFFSVVWEKISNDATEVICENSKTGLKEKEGATCNFEFQNRCFERVPTTEEIKNRGITIKLTLKNVDAQDLGSYRVFFFDKDNKIEIKESVFFFDIVENKKETLRRQTEVVIFLSALFLFCLIFAALIWWKFLYVRYFWRKRFEQFETDNKPYAAFLSYQFNSDMDKFCKEKTREVVETVRDELEMAGYKIYDEFKNANYEGYKSENAINAMKQCHRVVIILSSEYIKDHWSIFLLNKGFEEMINRKMKLVFVLLPGVREFIKQKSALDGVAGMLRTAIKTNCTINWTNKKKHSRKFVMQLLLAMPNLRNNCGMRHTSTSSSLIFPQEVHMREHFKRTMSSDTGMTELSSPVSLDSRFPEFELETRRDMSDRRIV